MEYNTDWKAIQQRFLPCKSKHQVDTIADFLWWFLGVRGGQNFDCWIIFILFLLLSCSCLWWI